MADPGRVAAEQGSTLLRIANIYGHGFGPGQLSELEGFGFSLRPQVGAYAGAQKLHFIDFPNGPVLELIEVTDRSEYESFVPAGMGPFCPGISLVAGDGSPAHLDRFERAFAGWDPYRLQVPYRAGSGSGAPGWHYLNFARPVVPGTFIWLTAFDQPTPASVRATIHANGALGVVGMLFDLPPAGLEGLSRLAGQPVRERQMHLGEVTVSAIGTPGPPKLFPIWGVVLQVESLDRARAHAAAAEDAELMGRPALRIRTNPMAWDLLLIP